MKVYSGNHSFLKDLNITSALRQIRSKGLISRAELALNLGLNRSTITAIINDLLDQKLVREVGTGTSKGGRPPTLLQFNKDAAYVACINWESFQIKIYITDLGGKAFVTKTIKNDGESPAVQIKQINQIIVDCLHHLPPKELGLMGIGVCVPGIIENGMVGSFDLGWDHFFPIYSYFAEDFDCPIVVDSVANAGLLAEYYFGSAIGESNFCYIRMGSELNAGILVNDQIFRGSEGFAGRVGHMSVEPYGRKCTCGSRGCWAAYASERALVHRYSELTGKRVPPTLVSMEKILDFARTNDPYAISSLHELAEYLGMGIASIINFLNPSLVIIGNEAINPNDNLLFNPLNTVLQQKTLPFLKRNVRVLFSSLGESAIPLGATALVIDHIFSTPILKSI